LQGGKRHGSLGLIGPGAVRGMLLEFACLDIVGLYGVAVERVRGGGSGGGRGMGRPVALAGCEGGHEKEEKRAGHIAGLRRIGMRGGAFFRRVQVHV